MQTLTGKSYFPTRSFSTLRDMIDQSAVLFSDRIAFRYRDLPASEPLTRTYGQFRSEIDQAGVALAALGLSTRSRLAIIGENSYAWCLIHATTVSGAGVTVPLDRLLPSDEIIQLLERGEAEAVFYDPSFHETVVAAAARLPHLKALICLRPDKFSQPPVFESPALGLLDGQADGPKLISLPELLAFGQDLITHQGHRFGPVEIDPDALMALLFTSGTTSSAKAVMLSQRNVCADVIATASVVSLWPGIRMLSVLPLHHTFENTCGLYMGLYYGAEIHEADGLRYIQKNLQEYRIDMLIGVPVLFENFYNKVQETLAKTGKARLIQRLIPITEALRKVKIDLRPRLYHKIIDAFGGALSLGICGAAPINPEIIRFFDAVGLRILQGYGLTETSPVVAGCNSRLFVPGTVGHPLGGVELAVDSEVPGEPGEILVRGPIVMLGYYQDEAATAGVIDAEGWFHTGDIGRIDPKNQCLTITGRQKSMIVLSSGKKVFPEEIEHLLGQSEFVKESLVWGELDSDGEVVISAKVVIDKESLEKKHGQPVDDSVIRQQLDGLIKEINSRMPTFKGIRHYVFSFQDMVKTTTLKIRRPIEIASIQAWMERQKLRLRDITGRNVDEDHDKPGQK
jgi:long-chain acyl-CoA synthetase